MKRSITIVLVLTLVLALALPGVAFAKRGGVPANGRGQAGVASADDGDKVKKDKKDKGLVEEAEGEEALEGEEIEEGEEGEEIEEGEEPEKLTGIENALFRLQRNFERKRLQVETSMHGALPPGLQATIAKFMAWLGYPPEGEGEVIDDPELDDTDDGLDEPEDELEDDVVDDELDEDVVDEAPEL